MNKPNVIFDMDGVLIDSEPFHREIWGRVFDQLQLVFTDTYYESLVGSSGPVAWEKVIDDFSLEHTVNYYLEFHKNMFYQALTHTQIPEVPGVLQFLKRLKKEGFSVSLGSSSPKKLISILVNRLEITSYFDYLISSEDVKSGKPQPDIFLAIAEAYEKDPEHFIVIEDSKHGVTAAKRAGMKCIAYKNKHSGNQDLSGADLIIESFDALNEQILIAL